MFQAATPSTADKAAFYSEIDRQLASLLAGERDFIANAANFSALLYQLMPDLNWAGVYLMRGDELVLGPFQGKPACVRIPVHPAPRGVCGAAAHQRRTQRVHDVHQFPGHIACDSASNSELVVPLADGERLVGVLDLDSPLTGRFDAEDQAGVERMVRTFLAATDLPSRAAPAR